MSKFMKYLKESEAKYVLWDEKRDLLWTGTKWLKFVKSAKKYSSPAEAEKEPIFNGKGNNITVEMASDFED
jgi:hypothetical protein